MKFKLLLVGWMGNDFWVAQVSISCEITLGFKFLLYILCHVHPVLCCRRRLEQKQALILINCWDTAVSTCIPNILQDFLLDIPYFPEKREGWCFAGGQDDADMRQESFFRCFVCAGQNFSLKLNPWPTFEQRKFNFSLGGYKVLIIQFLSALPFLVSFFFTTPWWDSKCCHY